MVREILRENAYIRFVSYIGPLEVWQFTEEDDRGGKVGQLDDKYRDWLWRARLPRVAELAGPNQGRIIGYSVVSQRLGLEHTIRHFKLPDPPGGTAPVRITGGKDSECAALNIPLFVDDNAGTCAGLAEVGVDTIIVRSPDNAHQREGVRAANTPTDALRSVLAQLKDPEQRSTLLRRQAALLRPNKSTKARNDIGTDAGDSAFDNTLFNAIPVDVLERLRSDNPEAPPRYKDPKKAKPPSRAASRAPSQNPRTWTRRTN